MIYAHIFAHEERLYIWYRYPFKFNSEAEEKLLENKIEATLFEESGDLAQLDHQVSDWMEAHGVSELIGFSKFDAVSQRLDLSDSRDLKQYIGMLRQEAHRMAGFLERERREKNDTRKEAAEALEDLRGHIFGLTDLLKMENEIMESAIDAGCKHIVEARAKFSDNIVYH